MPFGLALLSKNKLGGFGTSHAFAGHFTNHLGGGENFFLALARHSRDARIFAHLIPKSAIILVGVESVTVRYFMRRITRCQGPDIYG
jgi:hypothetical protein